MLACLHAANMSAPTHARTCTHPRTPAPSNTPAHPYVSQSRLRRHLRVGQPMRVTGTGHDGCGCRSHFSHPRARGLAGGRGFFFSPSSFAPPLPPPTPPLLLTAPSYLCEAHGRQLPLWLVQSHPDSDSSIPDPFQKPSSPRVASPHQYIWTMWLMPAQTLVASHGHTHLGHWHAAMLLNKECVTQNTLHSLFVFLNVRCSLLVSKQTWSMVMQNPHSLQQ